MLFSMTGYGRAEQQIGDKNFLVEIRCLNGKQFDVRMLPPALIKPYEIDIRNILNEGLERGSVECAIHIKQNGAAKPVTVNTELLKAYYQSITQVAHELYADTQQLLAAILRLPDVVVNNTEILTDDEWSAFKNLLQQAIHQVNEHRKKEGNVLENDLLQRVAAIEQLSKEIALLEPDRRKRIKDTLQKNIAESIGKENYDANRLEQELIYYIEKLDISEEQVRLANHLQYLKTVLQEKDKSKGKKIGFLLQEFGREINTTGSKANDAAIQKLVVLMKDELEKAKEQILNVL
jgi:uncharacterized protein (TIGR00255 family)